MFQIFTTIYCLIFGTCALPLCATYSTGGNDYTICRIDLNRSQIKLFLNDNTGRAYGYVSNLRNALSEEGRNLVVATNGGMYHTDLAPVGLYIENYVALQKISTRGGYGNFHLLPNGVFYIGAKGAGVLETGQYRRAGLKPQFATQSGPMLVIDSKLHPRFLKRSTSFKIRNGVGVSADGKTVFLAISHNRVRFWDLAILFRDHFRTPNALFLDGSISTLYTPQKSRGGFFPVGPIIAVFRKPEAKGISSTPTAKNSR